MTPPDTEDRGPPGGTDAGDDFDAAVARAYEATGAAWSRGPALVYDRLAVALVDASPVPLAGRTVLDVVAGTGAASLAAAAVGARVVAIDVAHAMVRANRAAPPALVGRWSRSSPRIRSARWRGMAVRMSSGTFCPSVT